MRWDARRSDLLICLGLFVGLCLVFQSIQRGTTPTYDAGIYIDVASNLADHGSVVVRNDYYGINTPYSAYGLGLSLVLVPFYLVQKAVQPGGQEVMLLVNQAFIAATAVLQYALARVLGASRIFAFLGALAFALLTTAPQQSTDLFSEPGVGLFTVMGVLGLAIWRKGAISGPWLLGVGVGGAIIFRADSILLCGLLVLLVPLFVPINVLRADRRWIYRLGAPLAVAVGYQLWYNQFRYGSILSTQYQGLSWSTPFFTGLYGNLLSPGKGLFIFCPFLILALPGLWLLYRKDRNIAVTILLLVLARAFFYAKWQSWGGGVGWGPRFMFPICAVLVLPAMETVRRIRIGPWRRRLVGSGVLGVIVCAGLALTALSVLVPFERWFQAVSGDAGGTLTPDAVARRVHDYYWTFRGNHIAGNIRLLDDVVPTNLRWFRVHSEPWGPILLSMGAALVMVTGIFIRRTDAVSDPVASDQGVARTSITPSDV